MPLQSLSALVILARLALLAISRSLVSSQRDISAICGSSPCPSIGDCKPYLQTSVVRSIGFCRTHKCASTLFRAIKRGCKCDLIATCYHKLIKVGCLLTRLLRKSDAFRLFANFMCIMCSKLAISSRSSSRIHWQFDPILICRSQTPCHQANRGSTDTCYWCSYKI